MAENDYHASQGYIKRLEVENFKSYKGHHRIGPFVSFTAVIGPNGSGKSNLMDAISFVLGVKTTQLRGSLKELLYSDGGATTNPQPRRGFVKLVYALQERSDGDQRLSERELSFARVILPTSSDQDATFKSEYRVDDQIVTWDAYCKKLATLGILVKVRNFLVFQGDIEAVAAKSPQGLTTLFEQISGSEALRARFDELLGARSQAEEKVSLLFAKRKQILAELKAKKREKEDAEKHAKALEELRGLKSDMAVWQLAVEGRSLLEAVDDQRQAEEALAALQVETNRRAAAGFKKEIALLEKKLKKVQQDRDKKSPALLKAKEELSRLVRNIRIGQKALTDKDKQVADQERKIKKLEADLKQVQVGTETTRQAGERKTLEAEQETDREQLSQLQTQIEQLRNRAAQLRSQAEEVRVRSEASQAELAEANAARQRLQLDQERLERALENIRMDRNQSRRDREISEMAERLKQRFPGTVYGKLVTLAKPIQSRYQLALSVAMQRDLDSVVVNNEATASQCIQILRDEKKPTMNFLPLDFLKVKPVNERLRQLGPGAKLAIDLLDIPDRRMERAFQFALGDTVICEDEDHARDLAFGGQRLKVVTLQGTLIAKRGTMTGGSAPPEARGARWDEGELTRLRRELEEVLASLERLPTSRSLTEAEQVLAGEMGALNSKIKYAEADAKESGSRAAGLLAQAERAEAEADRKAPEVQQLQTRMEARAGKIQRLTDAINRVTDRVMADFSRRVGVSSIRDWEERHASFEASVQERRRELTQRRTHTESQLEYERSLLAKLRTAAKDAAEELSEHSARQAVLEKEAAAAQAATADVEVEVKALTDKMDDLRNKVAAEEERIAELQRSASDLVRRTAELRRGASRAGLAVEDRATRMLDVVNSARLEQVKLPRKRRTTESEDDEEDEDEEMADQEAGATARGGGAFIDLDALVAGIGGGEDGGETATAEGSAGGGSGAGGSSGEGPPSTRALASAMSELVRQLDTSRLSRQQLAAETARERERVVSELRDRITALQSELDKAAPNMRAVEQYGAVKEREREQLAALHAAQAEATSAAEEFNRVRTQRQDLFSAAFKHISEQISSIYKDLTRSSTHPLGGQAYLHLENEEEPYAGGIKYTAIPPAKRFRDMEQLSGEFLREGGSAGRRVPGLGEGLQQDPHL
ncbi:structural maintenance of chromosomes protein 1 [Volvox carteri f. nagariensis]|uniref:Structural maintenance of chromosomes protein 1 n=1 Tax=Volvox carteri f. nagariensis TaxID=3068 RepID=D8UA74_VOLCA|nr:structural maintenance of chromosomes protein 1 [Volvox carteri f. nagariensis]EFJ43425.1 structural maintenance of chromosomes protein 1 [Volvox carteri f. nagariensis]|eukprot:XP_002955572.1 structural maintenance of chromosomes protein 1 [Volvox carteri f. nagariensis]